MEVLALRSARVSFSALRANAFSLVNDLGIAEADLRADAYGHGLLRVAAFLDECGIASVRVSSEYEASLVSDLGVRARVTYGEHPLETEVLDLGVGLFGIGGDGLTTTMTLSAEIISVKTVAAGSGVSYGYTYRTTSRSRLALVALGFADGVPRQASNRAPVSVNGFRGRFTGRVAMDQFVVDLGDHDAEVGDRAFLFGDGSHGEATVVEWAAAIGMTAEALLPRLGRRIAREYDAV